MSIKNLDNLLNKINSVDNFKVILEAYNIDFKVIDKNNIKLLCQFHNEHTPSCSITDKGEGAFFHCFGCGAGGDIVKFVKDIENIEFIEAIKKVCNILNIEIPNGEYTDQEKLEFIKKKIQKQVKNKKDEKINEDLKNLYDKRKLNQDEIEEAFHLECELDNEVYTTYKKELLDCLTINKNNTVSVDQLKVGDAVLKEYDFINNERFFYKYNNGIGLWEKYTKQALSSLITKDLKDACNYWSDSVVRGVTNLVYNLTYGNIEGEVFDQVFNKNPYNIVFKNGTLNLKTGIFEEVFYKEDYNTIIIPHKYNADAGTPIKTINFLSMMTDSIEEINFIFEWIGYLLVKSYPIAKMLFLVGNGGNGKSTLIKLMTSIVGENNTSAVSIKSLVNNRFQASLLYNKLFNTVADIGADFFDDSSIIKALTGDDTITIERKGENGFSYSNFAKMTYSCNKLPKFKDNSNGLERRPIVLNLNKDFINLVKTSDTHINDIINDEEEIEKIIAYSVVNFMQVLRNNNTFTESEDMRKAKSDWLNDDPLVDFVYEAFEITGEKEDIVTMKEFMSNYNQYCIDRNYKPLSQKNVIEAIKTNKELMAKGIKVTRMSNQGSKYKIKGLKPTTFLEWYQI